MRIRVGYELIYNCPQPPPMIAQRDIVVPRVPPPGLEKPRGPTPSFFGRLRDNSTAYVEIRLDF
jgi:hypothetical protein